MIHTAGGKFQSCPYVIGFEVGVFRDYLPLAHTGRQKIENIADPEAQATNAWPATAFAGFGGNT